MPQNIKLRFFINAPLQGKLLNQLQYFFFLFFFLHFLLHRTHQIFIKIFMNAPHYRGNYEINYTGEGTHSLVFLSGFAYLRNRFSWDDQYVGWSLRINISKCKALSKNNHIKKNFVPTFKKYFKHIHVIWAL